jgi:hypothetical protein
VKATSSNNGITWNFAVKREKLKGSWQAAAARAHNMWAAPEPSMPVKEATRSGWIMAAGGVVALVLLLGAFSLVLSRRGCKLGRMFPPDVPPCHKQLIMQQ